MWRRIPLCFELLSPLHIGFLPNVAGTLVAPSRLYVPGKNFWGAVTASLTPRLFPTPKPADFERVGSELKHAFRFSYFYLSDGFEVFLPSFENGELTWSTVPDSDFRASFTGSRLSTQVGAKGTAEDAGLHEIEFIKHRLGKPASMGTSSFLCGVFWLKDDCIVADRNVVVSASDLQLLGRRQTEPSVSLLADLSIGGERNYGFGRIRPAALTPGIQCKIEQCLPSDPDVSRPISGPLLGHTTYDSDVSFRGSIEILAAREYAPRQQRSYIAPGQAIENAGYCFAPGTVLLTQRSASLDAFGRMRLTG
jgi:hypothetical protein